MLEGKRINLRLFKEKDVPKFVELTSNIIENGEYWFGEPPSEVKLKKKFSENGFWERDWGRMLIEDKQGKIIGNLNFFESIPYSEGYEIGYRIYRPEDRGKGYMTEALRLFIAYLFALKKIERIQVCAFEENVASWKVAEKCDFTYEGTLRRAVYQKGKYHDLRVYSILREECATIDEVLERES